MGQSINQSAQNKELGQTLKQNEGGFEDHYTRFTDWVPISRFVHPGRLPVKLILFKATRIDDFSFIDLFVWALCNLKHILFRHSIIQL